MTTDSWINESLYPDWGQRFLVKRELARVQSDFQDIVIFESFSHGRVMVLDGVIQITEADEFVYQEMLAHVPLLAHGAAENVLIIGAGDGGVLRRVLQHRTVRRAVMVEIDGEVIRLSKEFLPGIAGDAWNDPRAEVIVGDGIDYVKRAPDASFDAIIVDSTDPIGVGEVLFTDEFYQNCARILTARGLVVNQCGVPAMQADELRETSVAAAEVLPACDGLCGRRADLCRRVHDAGVGGEGCLADRGAGGYDPGSAPRRRAFWERRSTGRRTSMSGRSICRRISHDICRISDCSIPVPDLRQSTPALFQLRSAPTIGDAGENSVPSPARLN